MITLSAVRLSNAQNIFHLGQNSSMHINTNTSVYINGNSLDSGNIKNFGTISFNGNLSVYGKYTSTGTERFVGSSSRTVNTPITDTNYFGHVVKNNLGKLIFQSNTDCDSITISTDGLIDLTSGATFKIKTGLATSIKGYGPSRYFDVDDNYGSLSRSITATNRVYVWPIGNSVAGYKRFDFTFSSLGTTGSSYVVGKTINGSPGLVSYSNYFSTGFNGNFPGQNCSVGTNPQLVEFTCMTDNYHQFAGPADYQHIVTSWSPSCGPGSNGPQRVLQSLLPTGDWNGNIETVIGTLTQQLCENSYWLGGSTTSIPGGTYQGFGDFAIAGGYGATLPVELISLTATPIDNEFIRIDWQTASELNNAGFEIQRSTDGIAWHYIGWINGNNTTNQVHTYQFDDRNVTTDIDYYYRLRQVDINGSFNYSKIVSANLIGTEMIVGSIYPNPSSNEQWVPLFLPSTQTVTILCFNAVGQEIWNKKIDGISGNQNIELETVSSGTYLLKIIINGEVFTRKFVKT